MWVVLEMFTPICQKTIHECFRFLGNGASQNLAMELNKQMEILKNTPQQYFPDHHSSKKKKKILAHLIRPQIVLVLYSFDNEIVIICC